MKNLIGSSWFKSSRWGNSDPNRRQMDNLPRGSAKTDQLGPVPRFLTSSLRHVSFQCPTQSGCLKSIYWRQYVSFLCLWHNLLFTFGALREGKTGRKQWNLNKKGQRQLSNNKIIEFFSPKAQENHMGSVPCSLSSCATVDWYMEFTIFSPCYSIKTVELNPECACALVLEFKNVSKPSYIHYCFSFLSIFRVKRLAYSCHG